ncbi:MAG: hypothetical protein AB7L41_09005 [Flavobacteriaceae bacterium]
MSDTAVANTLFPAKPSLIARAGVGKLAGLVVGLVEFFVWPWYWVAVPGHVQWATLLWYINFGAMIGLAGVIDRHPVMNIRLPWWVMGVLLGAWLNLVATLMMWDVFAEAGASFFGEGSIWASPWWFIAEGAVTGLVIGWLCNRFGGYGAGTAGR